MTLYYVGSGGSDASAGTSWALRKLTLNGVEDIPVVAGDTVYVAHGVYRELLTLDVSGTAGNIITYIGDVSGANTDGVGGTVRITGSDDDLTATRANCITATARSYRTFRGFQFDTTTSILLNLITTSGNWIVEDCQFQALQANVTATQVSGGVAVTFRRCYFLGGRNSSLAFVNASVIDNAGHVVENCVFLGSTASAVLSQRVGGITVRNNLFYSATFGIRVQIALTVGQTITVNNNLLMTCGTGMSVTAAAEITEDYNNFWACSTDRTTVGVGANSISVPPLFAAPMLLSGFCLPAQPFAPSEWSPIRALADSGAATDGLYGMTRPVTAAKRSWGPIQWVDSTRSTTQAHAGSASLKLADAGRMQMLVPVTAVSTTVSCWVYREASYAGTNPQLVVKQHGQADQTATDAAASGQWNLLTVTLTPAALPTWATAELVSNNTASGASIATYFDDLVAT